MEQVKAIKSFFARTGGKHFSKKDILPFIKDLKYKTYVEPFVGAGSIFLGREKKAEIEVINDFDILAINLWKGMKECGSELKDKSLYFQDKSVFKWWLLKEKQNRRLKQENYINDIETFKEDLFIVKHSRFSDTSQKLPNKKGVTKFNSSQCFANDIKIVNYNNTKEDLEVLCRIENNDNIISIKKFKMYLRKKNSDDETKWRLHNPNTGGFKMILQDCVKYQERLKDTLIHQGDYKRMIEMYDSPDTLFYFDPPWTKNGFGKEDRVFYSGFVGLEDFYNSVKDIKGKVMISYNNDPEILETFKDYNIEYINTIYTQRKPGNKQTVDILIMNF